MNATPLIFSLESYAYLRDELVAATGWDCGTVEVKYFPDGERYQRIETPVNGRHTVLVAGTTSDAATLELYDLACALAKYGALSLTIIIPYFGYSTMERAIRDGEIVTAKSRARLISCIPQAAYGNRVVFLDLHAEGIPHFLEGGIVPRHLYAKEAIMSICRELAGGNDFVLACTDAGRAKWVESLANDLHVPAAFIFKRRIDGRRTEVTAMNAQVDGKTVIIYDDMIRTGGSLINAAKAYKEAGATRIFAVATHGVLPEDAVERLRAADIFTQVAVTNSHPRTLALENDSFMRVVSVAPILSEYLTAVFS